MVPHLIGADGRFSEFSHILPPVDLCHTRERSLSPSKPGTVKAPGGHVVPLILTRSSKGSRVEEVLVSCI